MEGYPFTWERGRGSENWVEERLDRALAAEIWMAAFKVYRVWNLEQSSSNHSPIFMVPFVTEWVPKKCRFRFENSWVREDQCGRIGGRVWVEEKGIPIQDKIAKCGVELQDWDLSLTRNFKQRILICKRRMSLLRRRRDASSVAEFREVQKQFFEVLHQQELFWKQRAKLFWLKEGDSNSRYFHTMASARKKNNRIDKLRDSDGSWREWGEGLEEVILQYFGSLFTSVEGEAIEILQNVQGRISEAQNHSLLQPFTGVEVKEALFSMHPDKCAVCSRLNVQEATEHERYLGLPSMIGRKKKEIFSFIKELNL